MAAGLAYSSLVLPPMSVDHGIYEQQGERPLFLDVVPGMTVIVRHDYLTGEKADKDW